MKNIAHAMLFAGTILWSRPDGGVSVTSVLIGTPEAEAIRLKANGSIPEDYELISFNPTLPSNRENRHRWRWDRSARAIKEDLPEPPVIPPLSPRP